MDNENQFEEPFDAAQGKEKKEIATVPPAQVKVRTMQSDLKSLQESGGQESRPYSIEINHSAAEKKKIKGLFIILGIFILILIIVFGLIWLT